MGDHHLPDGAGRLWLPYTQMRTAPPPLRAAWTEGCRIGLDDGRVLLDGIASWWTACHGYNHPHIRAAVVDQLGRMPHVMLGGLVHEPALRLAERLSALLPGDLGHVFFADSGSVAVEVAIKMAVQSWLNRGVRHRTRLLAFRGGYHGDTFATMAACDPEEGMHALFDGVLARHHIADLPLTDADEAALDALLSPPAGAPNDAPNDAPIPGDVAAILVEPLVQGAGGMVFHPPEVLRRLRRLADRHGVPLILDEIFTGFGRTGTMFACQQAGIVPDIVTLSKALTGGTVALSAAVARPWVFELFRDPEPTRALMHGPTFMGNPLACAAANASLDLFEREDRLGAAAAIAAQLAAELEPCRTLPGVRDVRVLGAIGVVELDAIADPDRLRAALVAEGVWVRPFRTIVYLTPALTITPDELSRLCRAIHAVLARGTGLRPKR